MIQSVTLDQLRVLVAIVDEGSFGKAARALGRSQGAISYHVASLERLLELKLFDRPGRRRPIPTAEGEALIGEARGVLARMGQMRDTVAAIGAGVEARISLSVDSLFPASALARVLDDLRAAHPTVHVELRTRILGGVIDDVVQGHADIGIAGAPSLPEGLVRRPTMDVELVPVVARDHPIADLGRPVEDHELARYVHIILSVDRASDTTDARGFEGPHTWRVDDLHTRRELLLAGLGWSRMPKDRVEADLAAGRLRRIEVARWRSPTHVHLNVVHRRSDPLGTVGRWLLERLVDVR